ncbi:Uma2 family endonuclease [Solihabitans fulvus]|uniref:Uma2 family endonuclease n=2 Tax=Solihabitans fulvus TaxID=1892852 RepID=A0A5B2XMT8_9PSEU|nr:Uma2 family endonuclease [Solihabitans fulvus]
MTWPDHLLSLADWDTLPEDTAHHYEVVEGILHVSPRPVSDHQWALLRLWSQLDSQLPTELRALLEVDVTLFGPWPATVRAPDLVVVPTIAAKASPARYDAEAVCLAVEVISPGSRSTDRILKFAEYADAGIEHYWIVDLQHIITITTYRLVNGRYELDAEATDTLVVQAPAPLTVDVTALAS